MQSAEQIAHLIATLRGRRVMLDSDLAALYGVTTRRLNEQVRRNIRRFPSEFAFSVTRQEVANLKSQIATSSWGGKRKPSLAFTEHGAVMAATVLNSERAIEVSVYVVRAFIEIRHVLGAQQELSRRLDELQEKVGEHDDAIASILEAIRRLTLPPEPPPKRGIGFVR
jgi:hypothetical protein